MTKCDVNELVLAHAASCHVAEELFDVLNTSLRNYLRDEYVTDHVKVELRELCCMACGKSQGYLVVDQRCHDLFFLAKDFAENISDGCVDTMMGTRNFGASLTTPADPRIEARAIRARVYRGRRGRGTLRIEARLLFLPMKFRVTIEPDEDGMFIAECPALPGCISQGKTRDEAMANIRDAIEGYLESLKKHGEPIPSPITEAVVEVQM